MKKLIDILHREGCSLVVEKDGEVSIYNQKGVRDLEHLLKHEPEKLRGARIADKVTGKAAAGIVVKGGVKELYTDVMSKKAAELLDVSDVKYTFAVMVDEIIIKEGDNRCPLEKIVDSATTADEVVETLWAHFDEMKNKHKA